MNMLRIGLMFLLILIPLVVDNAFGSSSGSMHEVVSNDTMELYVVAIQNLGVAEQGRSVGVEVIFKNLDDEPRMFNPFFAKLVDADGVEHKSNPLAGSIAPVRIPSNDILRGVLVFTVLGDADVSTLVWREFDLPELSIDLAQVKEPADPIPKSDFVFSSNKGMVVSDGRVQITVNDELLNKNPRYYHADVSIKNQSMDTLSYHFAYFFVKDQDGFLYPTDVTNFQFLKNPLKKGDLGSNMEVRGEILFPLSDTVTDVMLIYDEELGGGSYFAVPEFSMLLAVMIMGISIAMVLLVSSRFKYLNKVFS